MAEKHVWTDRSDSETDTEGGGEADTSKLYSRNKKGHMTNIYLTDLDEAIGDFVKDHEESYDKTNEHFKDKARKDCLWQRFANSHKLSKYAKLGWNPKGLAMANSHSPGLVRLQKK